MRETISEQLNSLVTEERLKPICQAIKDIQYDKLISLAKIVCATSVTIYAIDKGYHGCWDFKNQTFTFGSTM